MFRDRRRGNRNHKVAVIAGAGSLKREAQADVILDATGLHVLPGFIDSHVHFREPGKEDREDLESGSRGAVLGGITCVFDMPNTHPSVTTHEVLEQKLRLAQGRVWCDYAFYVGADGENDRLLPDLEREPGVCGIKVFMSSSTTSLMVRDDAALHRVFAAATGLISIHAEDDARIEERRGIAERAGDVRVHGEWRDAESALLATKRAIRLARKFQRRTHILHVSTRQEIDLIAANKDLVSCEALPQHLTFAAPDCYRALGAMAQQNPPIREAEHRTALWRGVAENIVDVIGSDHGPHTLGDKAAPYPNMSAGMPGTQTLVSVMLNHVSEGRLTLERLIELTCSGPARVFGLTRKGATSVGVDADFTIVDLKARRTITNDWIASKVGWTAYDGMAVTGWPVGTVVRGNVVVWDGELIGQPRGRPAKFHGGAVRADRTALNEASL